MDMKEQNRILNDKLRRANDVINDAVIMMDEMRKEMEAIKKRNAELEDLFSKRESKPIQKTSRNSNLPPSSDLYKPERNNNSRKKSNKKSGGQKGHKGSTLEMRKDVDEHISLIPEVCKKCKSQLDISNKSLYSSRQVVDLPAPVKPIVEQYNGYKIECTCGQCNYGEFPDYVNSKIQYGPRVRSAISYMSTYQLIPLKRMQEYFKVTYDLSISQGTFINAIKRTAEKSIGIYETIQDYLSQSEVVGADETVVWVKGKKWQNWVWQDRQATFIVCEPNRRKDVIYKYFPHGFPNSILISDRYAAHLSTPSKGAQICWAHLLRELNSLEEKEDNPWIKSLRNIYERAKNLKSKKPKWSKTNKYTVQLEDDFDRLLLQQLDPKYEDTIKLQDSFKRLRHAIWTFLYHEHVTADNNASERAIRMAKIKMKISGGYKSLQKQYAILRSIIDTLVKNGKPIFETLFKIESGIDISLGIQ